MIRERLARLGDAVLNVLGAAEGSSAARPSGHAWAPVRRRDLEEQLAAANSEIERLRARLAEASRKPTSLAEMRAEEMAIIRQMRLWIARGGNRQS